MFCTVFSKLGNKSDTKPQKRILKVRGKGKCPEAYRFKFVKCKSSEYLRRCVYSLNCLDLYFLLRVTCVRPLADPSTAEEAEWTGRGGSAFRLASCEERGSLVVWTVLDSRHDPDQHLGLAHWGAVRLVR